MGVVQVGLEVRGRWRVGFRRRRRRGADGWQAWWWLPWSPNIVVTVGKELIAKMLMDDSADYDTGLTYVAIGTDNTTPAAGDTTLGVEVARAAVAARARVSNVVTFSAYFDRDDCTYSIEELGIFGSATATGSGDSGDLFSRALYVFDNSGGLYDLVVDYELTVG